MESKKFLAKGKRSKVFTVSIGGRVFAKKEKLGSSQAVGRLENEAKWLRKLNPKGIGPKLHSSGKDYVVMDYIPGERILDWIPEHSASEIKCVIKKVMEQCRVLDEMGLNKEEMHNPYKHIIMKGKKPVMIDFERSRMVKSPQNVRQFCQFLMSSKVSLILGRKKMGIDSEALIVLLKDYKKDSSRKNFLRILKALSL